MTRKVLQTPAADTSGAQRNPADLRELRDWTPPPAAAGPVRVRVCGGGGGEAQGTAGTPRFRLVRPHGFVDEYGQNRHWDQGEIVGDPAQLALLSERGAELAPVGEE